MPGPFSGTLPPPVGGLSNVRLNPNTLVTGDTIEWDSTLLHWKNAPNNPAVVNAQTIDVTNNAANSTFRPTFVTGSGVNKTLNCTDSNWNINPSTGDFTFVRSIDIEGSGGSGSVNVGYDAGTGSVTSERVAIGQSAGNNNQARGCVAVGNGAGRSDQAGSAVAIGNLAGNSRQGRDSIAIGNRAATITQPGNQINISTSGLANNGVQSRACYITELRGLRLGLGPGVVYYNSTGAGLGSADNELVYSTN